MTQTTPPAPDPDKRQKWMAFVQNLSPNIDPHAVRLMDELRMVSHTMYQIGESSLAVTGLSYAQYRILLGLYFAEKMENRGELNPSEISNRQGTSRNTISALIRSLEEEGLVERHLDREDRRKFNICLTAAGRQKVSENASRHMDVVAGCFEALTTAEQETMSQLLAKLSQHINAAQETIMAQAAS